MRKYSSYLETIHRVMDGDYKKASAEERQQAVKDVIQVCSAAAAAVSFQPIPFVDSILISPIQIALVQAIGRIHGHELDKKSVLEILSAFGASIVAQNVIMAAAKFIPFLGWVVTISMAYALTYAVGEVSDHYFKNGRGVPTDDLKDMFKKVYNKKKAEKQEAHQTNQTLKERLEQLTESFKAGQITEDQYNKKKEDILSEF